MTGSDDRFERELAEQLRSVADAHDVPAGLAEEARRRAETTHAGWRTGRTALVGAAAAVMLALAAAVAAVGGQDSANLRTIDQVSTTDPPPPSSTAPVLVPVTEETTTTTRPSRPTTTTTVPYPPARVGCAVATGQPQAKSEAWARYYRTEPAPDQPARVQVCLDRQSARIGDEVSLTLIGDDPDAVIVDKECGWEVHWGDTERPGSLCRDYVTMSDQPREAPKPEPGHIERSARHVFSTPGTYTITGAVWSGDYDGHPNPYSSYAEVKVSIVIEG